MKKRKYAGLLVLTGLLLTCGVAITSCSENPSGETNQDDDNENNNNNNNNENEGGNDNKPSEEKTFKVTVEKNDEVNVKTDKAEYKKGETVTLTLEILNADKEVHSIQVGENIEVKEVTKNVTYTFVMPEANVSVKVNLKDRVFEAHALKVNQVEGFEVKFLKDNLEVTEAKKGETVTVKITATSSTKRFVSFTSSDVQLNEVKKGEEYTFVMLDQEVNFVLAVEAIPSRKLAFKGDEGVSGVFKQDDKEVTSALEGSEVTLELEMNDEDYYFVKIDAKGTELKTIEEGVEYSFVVGTSDIEIIVTTAIVPTYELKVNDVEGAEVKFFVGGKEVIKAKQGENVEARVLIEEGYKFVSFTSNDVALTETSSGDLIYNFEMPAKEVNFSLVVEAIPSRNLTFMGDAGVSGVFKQNDEEVTSALEGSQVTLELTINEKDYYFASIDATGAELTTVEEGKEYSFIVGSSDIEIIVTTAAIPTYELKVKEVAGAKVKFLVDKNEVSYAKEGQNVEVQVLVEDGYEFISFTSEDVDLIEVDPDNLIYSFVMPANEVAFTLDVQYIAKEYKVLSVTEYDTWGDVSLEAGQTHVEGKEVKFTFDASSTYTYFVDVNDETYVATYNEETRLHEVAFVMPSCDIDVVIYRGNFESDSADAITITYEENENYKIYGIKNGGKYDKDGAVKIRIVPARGVKLNNVTYEIDNGVSTGKIYEDYSSDGLYSLSALKDATSSFKIVIDAEYVGAYDITLTNTEGVEVSGQLNGVLPGTSVSLTVSTSEDYQVASSNPLTYSCDNEEESFYATYSSYSNKITFTMPKGNVTLTLNLIGKRSLSFEEAEHISNVRFSNSESDYEYSRIDSAFEGDNVYVFFDIDEGYHVESIEIDGVDPYDITSYDNNSYFRFEMVDQDIAVKFNVVKLVTLSYESEKVLVTGLDDYLIPGEEYTFKLEALKGFKLLGDPKLVDSEGNPVEVEVYENYYGDVEYTFIAPDKDLTLIVETEAVATPTMYHNFDNLEGYDYYSDPYIQKKVSSGDQVTEGEILTISNFYTSYIAYGYELEGIFLVFDDGSSEKQLEVPSYGSIEFEAPGKDFTVEIRIKKLEMTSINYELPEGVEIDVSVDYETIYEENGTFTVVKGETAEVTLTLDYSHSDDYYIDLTKLKVTNSAGDILLTIDEANTKVEEYSFKVTMEEDVNINLSEINEYAKYSVSVREGSQFSDSLSIRTNSSYSSEIKDPLQRDGTELTAYLDDLTSDEFNNNTYTLQIYNEAGELVNEIEFVAELDYYYYEYYGATFTVPNYNIYLDVVVTPNA